MFVSYYKEKNVLYLCILYVNNINFIWFSEI